MRASVVRDAWATEALGVQRRLAAEDRRLQRRSMQPPFERMEAQVPPIDVRVECEICAHKERRRYVGARTAEMDGAKARRFRVSE